MMKIVLLIIGMFIFVGCSDSKVFKVNISDYIGQGSNICIATNDKFYNDIGNNPDLLKRLKKQMEKALTKQDVATTFSDCNPIKYLYNKEKETHKLTWKNIAQNNSDGISIYTSSSLPSDVVIPVLVKAFSSRSKWTKIPDKRNEIEDKLVFDTFTLDLRYETTPEYYVFIKIGAFGRISASSSE